MLTRENECVGCPPEMGCRGSSCPYNNVLHVYCDKCEEDITGERVFKFFGKHYCMDCLIEKLKEQNYIDELNMTDLEEEI